MNDSWASPRKTEARLVIDPSRRCAEAERLGLPWPQPRAKRGLGRGPAHLQDEVRRGCVRCSASSRLGRVDSAATILYLDSARCHYVAAVGRIEATSKKIALGRSRDYIHLPVFGLDLVSELQVKAADHADRTKLRRKC